MECSSLFVISMIQFQIYFKLSLPIVDPLLKPCEKSLQQYVMLWVVNLTHDVKNLIQNLTCFN